MIQLKGINKTYFNGAPLHVLKGIDLDIEKGEMVSIMGASGSGKYETGVNSWSLNQPDQPFFL